MRSSRIWRSTRARSIATGRWVEPVSATTLAIVALSSCSPPTWARIGASHVPSARRALARAG